MSRLAAIARSFGAAADHYDQHARLQRDVADTLGERLPTELAPATCIDLGCGTGYCSVLLQQRFPESTLISLDLSLPMLEQTRARGLGSALLCADAGRLPLRDNCAALVFSSLAIQWVADPQALFAELARVLEPGGTALVSSFGPATLQELRLAWATVDEHQHVNRFVPLPLMQAAAQEAGLQCSIERELRYEYHASLAALSRALKAIGAQQLNGRRRSGLTTPRSFRRAEARFMELAEGGKEAGSRGVPVTWELYYLCLQKPAPLAEATIQPGRNMSQSGATEN